MIGGLGPESTVDYYNRIIALYRERKGDGSYPQFLINSIDLEKGRAFIEKKQLPALAKFLIEEVEKLAKAGADFGVLAANTPHLVFDEVAAESSIPLISMVEAACADVQASGLRRLALFGTRYTMQADFYAKVFSKQNIELITPHNDEQDYIHDKYFNELIFGKFRPETHAGLLAIVDRMKKEEQVEALLLAGTELTLILREPDYNGLPFIDTAKIHCQAIVAEMLS